MASLKEVKRLSELCEKYELEGREVIHGFSNTQLGSMYNGIGPEFLPIDVRAKVTEWLALFEPAALIHDCRVGASDGWREGFLASNDEFRRNCLTLADRAYPDFPRSKRKPAFCAGFCSLS